MNFDALTVAAVCDELRSAALRGRVQHVHHPDEMGLAFELFSGGTRRWLYCTAHPQNPRLHLVSSRPGRSSDAVTPLLLLARKFVDGARLEAIACPALERVAILRFSKRSDEGDVWRSDIVVEAIGRSANVILLDADGTIRDALHRIPVTAGRSRVVQPQYPYVLPPAPVRLDPRSVEAPDLAAAAADDTSRPLRAVLVARVGACSPLLAREIVYAVHGDADVESGRADWIRLAAAFRDRWEAAAAGRWEPCLAYENDRLVAFAPYRLASFATVEPATSISGALETWFGRPIVGADDVAKRPLRDALLAAQDRARGKVYSLRQSAVSESEVQRLREAGEALLAYQASVPSGAAAFRAPGAVSGIPLDSEQDALANARSYFDRYAKAKAAAREVPGLLAAAQQEQRYLDEALTNLELAASPGELADLRAEWSALGYVRGDAVHRRDRKLDAGGGAGRTRGGKGSTGIEHQRVGDFEVLVGRSGRGNDAIVGPESHPEDVWLHARGVPGAHVLIRCHGRAVPDVVLRQAAALAAARSQARSASTVPVDFTKRRYVQKIKGAPPGMVTYRGERTIHVPPDGWSG
jgi:predicted ribosome quality control (RQC) complex YloA/Tae2 family protein